MQDKKSKKFNAISELRKNKKLTQKELAQLLKCNQSAISEIEKGKRDISRSVLLGLIDEFNINANWVMTGRAPMYLIEQPNSDVTEHDLIQLHYYEDIRASAYGESTDELEFDPVRFGISGNMFSALGVSVPKTELLTIRVFGDAMSPRLEKGDLVLMSRWDGTLLEGEIYVVRYYDEVYIKHIQNIVHNKKIRLLSINPNYEPMEIQNEHLDQLQIMGRVIMKLGRV